MNRSLAGRGTRSRVGALKRVEALLLLASDFLAEPWAPANSSCFLMRLAIRLTQKLYQVVWDFRTIAKDGDLNEIFLNELADLLNMELLEL